MTPRGGTPAAAACGTGVLKRAAVRATSTAQRALGMLLCLLPRPWHTRAQRRSQRGHAAQQARGRAHLPTRCCLQRWHRCCWRQRPPPPLPPRGGHTGLCTRPHRQQHPRAAGREGARCLRLLKLPHDLARECKTWAAAADVAAATPWGRHFRRQPAHCAAPTACAHTKPWT